MISAILRAVGWHHMSERERLMKMVQQSAREDREQREYVTHLVRTGPAVAERIRERWRNAETWESKRAYCLERWRSTLRSHCAARWSAVWAGRTRLAPIPMRREASAR